MTLHEWISDVMMPLRSYDGLGQDKFMLLVNHHEEALEVVLNVFNLISFFNSMTPLSFSPSLYSLQCILMQHLES